MRFRISPYLGLKCVVIHCSVVRGHVRGVRRLSSFRDSLDLSRRVVRFRSPQILFTLTLHRRSPPEFIFAGYKKLAKEGGSTAIGPSPQSVKSEVSTAGGKATGLQAFAMRRDRDRPSAGSQ